MRWPRDADGAGTLAAAGRHHQPIDPWDARRLRAGAAADAAAAEELIDVGAVQAAVATYVTA